jgi:beta-galactosidase
MSPRNVWLLTALLGGVSLLAAEPLRTRESFDADWRFARFGLMPDGSRQVEPGGSAWTVAVTASSEEADKGNLAGYAMDNDPGTRWCAANGSADQWLMLDLGSEQDLASVSISWEMELAYKFVVEGSLNKREWKILADKSQNADTAQTVTVPLQAKTRFVRIRTTGLPAAKWASICEVSFIDAQGKTIENKKTVVAGSPEAPAFDDQAWRRLDVPHDWGIEGPFRLELRGDTGKLPWKGIGWYRKHFTVGKADEGKRVFIDFDGAMAYAKVWLNGQYLGTWPYGYNSFRMELTPHLKYGQENILSVRLDTEKWDSRWYPGAGIYRHVWLVKTAPVHVGHWGTYVTTPALTDDSGTVSVRVTVDNQTATVAKPVVQAEVYEMKADGSSGRKVAATTKASLEIAVGGSAETGLTATVAKPKLWDLAKPTRYLVRTIVSLGGQVVDEYDTPFGFRTLEFTPRDGFKLNGKRVEIQGT